MNMLLAFCLVLGAVAGWLSGAQIKRAGFERVRNTVAAAVGAIVGGIEYGLLGDSVIGLIFGSIITATIWVTLLFFVIGQINEMSMTPNQTLEKKNGMPSVSVREAKRSKISPKGDLENALQ